MKHKHLTFVLAVLMSMVTSMASTYDFEAYRIGLFQYGRLNIANTESVTIDFVTQDVAPYVVVGMISNQNPANGITNQVQNITKSSFKFRFYPWQLKNPVNFANVETADYLVLPPDTIFHLGEDMMIISQKAGNIKGDEVEITFPEAFPEGVTPVVLAQQNTGVETDAPVTVKVYDVTNWGFKVKLVRQEGVTTTFNAQDVNYVACNPGQIAIGENKLLTVGRNNVNPVGGTARQNVVFCDVKGDTLHFVNPYIIASSQTNNYEKASIFRTHNTISSDEGVYMTSIRRQVDETSTSTTTNNAMVNGDFIGWFIFSDIPSDTNENGNNNDNTNDDNTNDDNTNNEETDEPFKCIKDGIYYNLTKNNAEVCGANANKLTGDLIIPEQITYGGKTYVVTSIASSAFLNAEILSITIPQGIMTIGESAFEGCNKLTKACFTNIKHICEIDRANNKSNPLFYAHHLFIDGKEITNVIIPGNVETIKSYAFEGCTSFTSLIIENGVKSIAQSAFCGDIGISEVNIPESIVNIGPQAFDQCKGLTTLIIPNATSIDNYAFRECTGLNTVTIGEKVVNIGEGAFQGCASLQSCKIGGQLGSIGDAAFKGCSKLRDIAITSRIIPQQVFYGCTSLSSIILGEGVEEILSDAFNGCKSLSTVDLPPTVKTIGKSVFCGCTSLRHIGLGENLHYIGENAFSGCESMTEIVIPHNVDSIGNGAFDGCKSLSRLTLADSEKIIKLGRSSQYKKENITIYTNSADWDKLKLFQYNGLFADAVLEYLYIGSSITYDQSLKVEERWGDSYVGGWNYYLYLYNSPFDKDTTIDKLVIGEKVKYLGPGTFDSYSYYTQKDYNGRIKFVVKPDIFSTFNIKSIYSMALNAPLYAVFSSDTYKNADLYIPEGTFSSYSTTDGWKEFLNFNEFDPTGVNDIQNNKDGVKEIYSLNGQKVRSLQKGINIIRFKDGTMKKVLIK